MIKYLLLLTVFFSCATTEKQERREEIPSVCRNTLQRDIHRDECLRY
jgi:hypothetical protein